MIDHISYRKLGIKLLQSTVDNAEALISFVKEVLKLPIGEEVVTKDIFKGFQKLRSSAVISNKGCELSASIHKSKGLEADSVLVVARNNSELAKWMETDREKRFGDKKDDCRLGFVAFSRAKEILCIACKEKISDELKEKLIGLDVKWR
jgi:DNA helicase-2/ATP-dependent DNA helicase PcrA